MRILVIAALCAALGGCGTTAAVIGHCELPDALTHVPAPVEPTTPGMSLEDQHKQWIKDRGHATSSDHQIAATIDFVGKNCQ